MDQRILKAAERTEYGKAAAVKLRKAGRIPAVMYDRHGVSVSIDVDEREFIKLFKVITESTIVKIQLGDNEHEVFIKDYQYNMVTDKVEHVDFYEVERGKLLRTNVKVRLQGSPIGVRHGGVLEAGISEIEVECLPRDLPPRIIVDVSNLDVNHALHVKDIKVEENVTILTEPDMTIAAVKFVNTDVAPSGEGETAEEEKAEA